MKMMVSAIVVAVVLWVGLVSSIQGLAAVVVNPSEDLVLDQSLDRLRRFALHDAGTGSKEYYGFTETPLYEALEIHASDNPEFEYVAHSPYYKVFFKGKTVRMTVGDAWIEFELTEAVKTTKCTECESNKQSAERTGLKSIVEENSLSVSSVFESVDLSYQVDTSLLTEKLTLKEPKQFETIIQKVSWGGITPEYEEDGSILFSANEREVLKILPPFMKDAVGAVCEDLHYGLVETETGYELHKIIDEKGLEWLEQAVYPVVIDPSMQTFQDAWESSGLTPYGQYFKNLKEFVNPANGFLTVTQTDLVIPGRGLDLTISRVYQTPAVFYGSDPYDYESPPVDVGKGWQLDFPYVGSKYLHLWGGTVYLIKWDDNTFENHRCSHFILVKNGDSTYTLTTASGIVYKFNTSGKLTQIKDIDQNTIALTYSDGDLVSITDTLGRAISLTYDNDRLSKITYNSNDIDYSYDANGCLAYMEDFLNRKTEYSYNTGYNNWLLSEIEYITEGYTTYAYDRFTDSGYYKYYVTDQITYETSEVRIFDYSYSGSFSAITSSTSVVKNGSSVEKGSFNFTINSDGVITESVTKNSSGTPMRKFTYTYNSNQEIVEQKIYSDGTNLSYTTYHAYDNWGNMIYSKDAEGHEKFFSYANTNTSGFFVDNNNTIIKKFTNAFSNCTVPSSVHSALIGTAEKQDTTYVKEAYLTYDSEAHPTQSESAFGDATTWLTYSGTFNEKTGNTSFPIDLTGHTVTGNGVLQITGLPGDDLALETHSFQCDNMDGCKSVSGSWQGAYYKLNYQKCVGIHCVGSFYANIGPFTHKPGTLGYVGYFTQPSIGEKFSTYFYVKTQYRHYPAQVQYNLDNSAWKTVSSDLKDSTAQITVPITGGSHTLYFSESSTPNTKFSWYLYVPVDNTPDTSTITMQYDTYGNVTSITDAESNTVTFTYSSSYSYAYLTEISATVGSETITTKATYDYNRGWITSVQQPKGVDAGSGYDVLYTYDLSGRITKKEFPLLTGQSQRTYLEAIYDDTNRKVTIIDQFRHYMIREYDKLGRLTSIKWHTGTYGSGTLYATRSYTYRYDNLTSTVTDPDSHTYSYTYDFLGRVLQISYPDSTSVSYVYDDTNYKTTTTNGRGYDKIYWFDWLGRMEKVEEEYATNLFAVTTYQYDEIGHLTSFTDAENHTTSYECASFYGLTKTTYPDSTFEEYEYNDAGIATSITDAKGNETTFTYDSLYRLTELEFEDQSTVSFTYDLNSNRTKMEDDAPNAGDYAEYTYDQWNRLITETRHISTSSYTVSCEYDVASRLTKLTYPDSMQILYFYDDLNRTTEIKRYVDGSNDEILLDNTQYSTEGLLTQFDYGNDLQATFSYNTMDRLLTIDVKNGTTSFLDLDYAYDNNGNNTQLVNGWRDTDTDWHSDTESYSYDGLDRLTSASCTSWSHSYSYDKVGNRSAEDSITYTVNAVDEVTALSDGTSFTYDDNGNVTQKTKGTDTWTYTYDLANRLKEVKENSATLGEYVYDGGGNRIQVTENSVTTTYMYSGMTVLYEENSTGTATYIYGPTGRLAKRTTIQSESHNFYYHTDKQQSTRQITDENRNIVTAVTYHPFGNTYVEEGSDENHLFCGMRNDATGLMYCGARYYDPGLGRFITRDPIRGDISTPQSLNRYTYCLNNPMKFVDPSGLDRLLHDIGNPGNQGSDDTGGGDDTDDTDDTDESGQDVQDVIDSDPSRLIIVLDDGTIITLTEWAQSGNVIVGYGYVTKNTDGIIEMEQEQALCILVFDDEGGAKADYWLEDRVNKDMDAAELQELAEEMKQLVGEENVQDLANAMMELSERAFEIHEIDMESQYAQLVIAFFPVFHWILSVAFAASTVADLIDFYVWGMREITYNNIAIFCGYSLPY